MDKIKVEIGNEEYLELKGKKIKAHDTKTSYETRRKPTHIESTEVELEIKVERRCEHDTA